MVQFFDEQNYLHPIRRRIVLSVLFERVQSDLQQIQATGNILKRGQTFKGVANDALLDRRRLLEESLNANYEAAAKLVADKAAAKLVADEAAAKLVADGAVAKITAE